MNKMNSLLNIVLKTMWVNQMQLTESLFDIITSTLKAGGDVKIAGFGTFKVANTKAKTGRNPRTGESIQIPASKSQNFLLENS